MKIIKAWGGVYPFRFFTIKIPHFFVDIKPQLALLSFVIFTQKLYTYSLIYQKHIVLILVLEAFLLILINGFLIAFYALFMRKTKWAVWKEIFVILLAYVFLYFLLGFLDSTFIYATNQSLFVDFGNFGVSYSSIYHVLFGYLFLRMYAYIYKKYYEKRIKPKMLTLDLGSNVVTIPENEIVFVKAEKNNVVFYLEDAQKKRTEISVRSTLKKILREIRESKLDSIIECHRSYIINKDRILDGKFTQNKPHIRLSGHSKVIPISKRMIEDLKEHCLGY